MQGALRRSLWSASKFPARLVAGRRYPLRPLRNFSTSPNPALSSPAPIPAPSRDETDEQPNPQSKLPHDRPGDARSVTGDGGNSLEVAEPGRDAELVTEDVSGNGGGNGDKDRMNYGSGLRRSMRNRKPKDIPPWEIPDWFFKQNVKLHHYDPPFARGVLDYGQTETSSREDAQTAAGGVRESRMIMTGASEYTAGSISNEANQYEGKLDDLITALREQVKGRPDIQTGKTQISKEVQTLLSDIRERIRVARRDRNVDELVTTVEKLVGQSSPELQEYRRPGHVKLQQAHDSTSSLAPEHDEPFQISSTFMNELLSLCAASFSSLYSSRPNIKLLCPIEGATYLIDRIVNEVAIQLEADVIRLDSQDLAQIVGDYVSEASDAAPDGLWTLGYDTGPFSSRSNQKGLEEEVEQEDEVEEEAEEYTDGAPLPMNKFTTMNSVPVVGIGLTGNLDDIFKKISNLANLPAGIQNLKSAPRANGSELATYVPARSGGQEWNDMKMSALLDFVLDANNVKERNDMLSANLLTAQIYRSIQQSADAEVARGEPANEQRLRPMSIKELLSQQILPYGQGLAYNTGRKTVIYIRGYRELQQTTKGNQIMYKITDLVRKKRRDGQQIMIIGASSSIELAPKLSGDTVEALQADSTAPSFRSLVVAPKVPETESQRQRFELQLDEHAEHHLFSVNARHLHNMLLRLQGQRQDAYARDWMVFAEQLSEESPEHLKLELRQRLLPVDEVHRIVFTAVGIRSRSGTWQPVAAGLHARDIASAGTLVLDSDSAKTDWAEEEQIHRESFTKIRPDTKKDGKKSSPLPKNLSKREKRLTRGVINADKIHTTFQDVHAPEDTIEALKTLTTLSLKRPDAFKYGVLATDKISGLLLYGPPGTGKTMLAKAVAKDTGATMLEVSGSDLYDMYVGEGEKNVAAVFSLAKKLAPCVVFIDEADAIFASRGSGGERKSHREMINQFLKEWDGMNETTAFIMVATNRPFDLDEAALRRLPRRILVDLPSEKDREAILDIHLKGEQVDDSVSISKLASQTPLYSGSDLKNIAVAAALAAVREENDLAAKHEGAEPYTYPEKRTLSRRHFDKAMEEISASISEDMDSLGAIKKFDEKYGDRRGRRKRTVYGFAGAEIKEETAKVRS